ncbi:NACHT domain-containing protein [Mangrovimicrobium sediminis]|uniref:NACHT domain-containing protein n=1 Tax=Mangrovimicrobium sediminis TaxID=2562682 RepID=A0A4Z0LYD2_9GAMM|nr:NACHT domain-containing protein [Haliea sp. SAOS-164]TGD72186.1 NACHT domain-containing protein [Haliea sp. SAOS-164]
MNAFEFVNQALDIKNNELDAILQLTEGSEVDWLEFKAAIKAQNPQEAAESNDADYVFNLIKALVSMANGSGGMVVLGIDDEGNAVGLDKSGFDGNRDSFTRLISDKVLNKDGWRTQNRGRWRWKVPTDRLDFDPYWARYQGTDVLLFAVAPRDFSHGPLVLTHATTKNSQHKEVVLVRAGGDRGTTANLSHEEAETWWEKRDLAVVSPKFDSWIKELQKTDPAVYFSTVSTYCHELVEARVADEQLFVPLEATARQRDKNSGRRRYQSNEDYLSSERSSGDMAMDKSQFLEIATRVYPAFLVGEPGSGKSTSLLKLVRDINFAYRTVNDDWALYIPISGYTGEGLRDLICREIRPLKWADISLALESGQLALVLDGLNECPSPHFKQCTTDLSDLLKEFPGAKIIVSTRAAHLPYFAGKTIELRSMGTSQQQRFVAKYLDDVPDTVQAFWESLTQKSTAQMIARSPLLLQMTAWLWRENGELPDGLADLYSRFFGAWLRREVDKDLSAGEPSIYSEDETQEALALLAYSMRCDGLVACTPGYAEDRLRPALGDRTTPFIDRTVQGLLIQTIGNGSNIRFTHETIQEYLVAVFLTSHPQHHLLQAGKDFDLHRWSMPIVFAFELFDHPPEHFVQAAWQISPLLACAAFRDDARLKILPEPVGRHSAPQNDLWVRGIIRCMRGEDVDEVTRSLAYLGRTPSPGRHFQKHPLPDELTSALEGVAFWYALTSFSQGRVRLERLQHLLIDRRNVWLELLPHVVIGQPDWLLHMTSAQKLVVGELEDGERADAIANATVVELSFMVRNKIIGEDEFRGHWKRALNVNDGDPLELELLALLATKKVNTSQFNGAQRAILKNIGQSTELSPRILNVLTKDRVLQVEEIRQNRDQILRLADSVSPVRAMQLIKRGVLRRNDFTAQQLHLLFERAETDKDIGFILEAGLAQSRQQIPLSVRNRVHGHGGSMERNLDSSTDSVVRNVYKSTDKRPSELIAELYLSPEQRQLERVQREIQDPCNFPAGSGYHRELEAHIEASSDWPLAERLQLIDLAEAFFLSHGSKKRLKDYRALIRTAREAILSAQKDR